MTTFVLPVLVSVTACVLLWPTVTFEKFSVEGEIESPDWVPVAVSEIISGEFEASLITVIEPLIAPAAVGANCTCTVLLCPTAREPDGLPLTTEKPVPVRDACEMFTVAVPVLVIVTLWLPVLPTATLPNCTVVALAESTPAPVFPGPVLAALV